MQIMFGTILCVLLIDLIPTKATNTSEVNITSDILQEEDNFISGFNFTSDISTSEESDILNLLFKFLIFEQNHSDSIVRNEREVDEITRADISMIPIYIQRNLSKPTFLRAFVQFDSQFAEKVNDIFVTLRWNHPKITITDEIIQGYQVQCSFFEDFKEICDDKNITATKLEHTVHNLIFNRTYYFRVRAHTKIAAGPYSDLINVSTTHENPIPTMLLVTDKRMEIWDLDLNITNFVMPGFFYSIKYVTYLIQEQRIFWGDGNNLMTLKINENNITKIASFDNTLHNLCIDWVARNLYFSYYEFGYCHVVKFDLTMWENGIIKFDEILKARIPINYLNVSPFIRSLYYIPKFWTKGEHLNIIKTDLDGIIEQIISINDSFCLSQFRYHFRDHEFNDMIIDNMNEEPLIYWLSIDYIFVTDIDISKCNIILHNENIGGSFKSMAIDKTYIYILPLDVVSYMYVLNKKYASLKSVNAVEYLEKTIMSSSYDELSSKIYAFDKSVQPYSPSIKMKCLTPDEEVYNFVKVNATANSIIVKLPWPFEKSGCKRYNLPTTIYNISVSHGLDNNKSEEFSVLTDERYYEIQNLTPFTEYKLKFTLSNVYFDQLSIIPYESDVISIKTNSGKLNASEN